MSSYHNQPSTPLRSTASSNWVPPTPRYAPIDEPDMFPTPMGKKASSQQAQQNFKQNIVPNVAFPLTPEQTPANRKRKDLEVISGSSQNHARILFPTLSPAKGSGRSYGKTKSHQPENPELTFVTVRKARRKIEFEPMKRRKLDTQPEKEHRETHTNQHSFTKEPSTPERPSRSNSIHKNLSLDKSHSPDIPIFNDRKAFQNEQYQDNTRHPHADASVNPNVKGMWYNFRGKKVFRPFDSSFSDDEIDQEYKPRILFGAKNDGRSLEMSCPSIKKRQSVENSLFPLTASAGDKNRSLSKGPRTSLEESSRPISNLYQKEESSNSTSWHEQSTKPRHERRRTPEIDSDYDDDEKEEEDDNEENQSKVAVDIKPLKRTRQTKKNLFFR